MKGIVFSVFANFVETIHGLEVWDEVLNVVQPISKGIYTSGSSYSDAELFVLIGALSKITGESVEDLVFSLGYFMLNAVAKIYPALFRDKNLKEFLLSIDSVIHVEVKKLYPDADTPTFTYEDPGQNQLVMIYFSKRKMCRLAEGLIAGAADHFKENIVINKTTCCGKGDASCRFEIGIF